MHLLSYLLKEANILPGFIKPVQPHQSSTAITNGSPMRTFGSSTSNPMGEHTIPESPESASDSYFFVYNILANIFALSQQQLPLLPWQTQLSNYSIEVS